MADDDAPRGGRNNNGIKMGLVKQHWIVIVFVYSFSSTLYMGLDVGRWPGHWSGSRAGRERRR